MSSAGSAGSAATGRWPSPPRGPWRGPPGPARQAELSQTAAGPGRAGGGWTFTGALVKPPFFARSPDAAPACAPSLAAAGQCAARGMAVGAGRGGGLVCGTGRACSAPRGLAGFASTASPRLEQQSRVRARFKVPRRIRGSLQIVCSTAPCCSGAARWRSPSVVAAGRGSPRRDALLREGGDLDPGDVTDSRAKRQSATPPRCPALATRALCQARPNKRQGRRAGRGGAGPVSRR